VTVIYVGFSVLHERRFASDAAARVAALRLIESPSWGTPVRYFLSTANPGHALWRKPGMVALAKLGETADAALQSEVVSHLTLASASYVDVGYRSINFSRDARSEPFAITHGERPLVEQDPGKVGAEEWISDVVDFFDAVSCGTGGIAVMRSSREISSECSEASFVHEGVLAHPFPAEHARTRMPNREQLGTKYMRFPRWGTLVNHAHVAQLGGIAVIERAVEPAMVRTLTGGVYFQLTASVADAMGDEAMEKQRRFTELAEPLLPPPIASR
jgi:hypothetical protein